MDASRTGARAPQPVRHRESPDADDLRRRPLQVGRAVEHDARHADGDDQLVDPADRAAGHLPRHRHRPARAGQHELPALADPRLPRRDGGAASSASAGSATSTAACGCSTSASPSSRVFSILLSVTWMHGSAAALWLIVMRVGQGVGGALLFANSSAILTDAFPTEPARPRARRQRDRGDRRLVPRPRARRRARAGHVAARLPRLGADRRRSRRSGPTTRCASSASRRPARIDWWGNATFAARPVGGDGRDHLRDPAVRRPHDGLDVPVRARDAARRRRAARRVLRDRAARRRADVPPRRCSGSARSPPATSRRCSRRWAAAACSSS